jgi:MiaB-like tRNA modifying enzyme
LAGCLKQAGHVLVDSLEEAELVVYNTCAVKGPTEDRVIEALRRIPSRKKIIVAGCLPMINRERLQTEVRFEGIVGPAAGSRIVEAAERVADGEEAVFLARAIEALPSLALPRIRLNPTVSIVPISYGCLGSCAYCCVTLARGRLRSYKPKEIIRRAEEDIASGAKEVWLTSEDVACYGRDIGSNLPNLLSELCKIDADFMIRVGMMTPNMATDIQDDLLKVFEDRHVYKFVHLPVQSGDNQVLKRMNRKYTADDFRSIVSSFKNSFSEITLSTDVICGFPGEREKDFDRTLKLVEEVKPDIVNVSKFFTRPGTAACQLRSEAVGPQAIKQRSAKAAFLAKRLAYENNARWIGWQGQVTVDEKGKVPGSWIARNFAYKPVVVRDSSNLLGRTFAVRVTGACPTYLEGTAVG